MYVGEKGQLHFQNTREGSELILVILPHSLALCNIEAFSDVEMLEPFGNIFPSPVRTGRHRAEGLLCMLSLYQVWYAHMVFLLCVCICVCTCVRHKCTCVKVCVHM